MFTFQPYNQDLMWKKKLDEKPEKNIHTKQGRRYQIWSGPVKYNPLIQMV